MDSSSIGTVISKAKCFNYLRHHARATKSKISSVCTSLATALLNKFTKLCKEAVDSKVVKAAVVYKSKRSKMHGKPSSSSARSCGT